MPEKTARVIAEHKASYVIRVEKDDSADAGTDIVSNIKTKEYKATVRGKFYLDEDFPKVGDFVEYAEVQGEQDDVAVIEKILPRKTLIVRDMADRTRNLVAQKPQIIVTNVDVMFIVMGLDGDFNLRRLERYLVLARQSKTEPVIVLNKADLLDKGDGGDGRSSLREKYESDISAIAPETPIHFLNALNGEGVGELLKYFDNGATAVLLGSSGAGKSTITNKILGYEKQSTGEIREDDSRGRHTTTSRELFNVPTGGYLIDTPGMRSLGMLGSEENGEDEKVFTDIEELMLQCKYAKCDHEKSEGCAVQEAIKAGGIDEKQFLNFKKIQKEKEFKAAKADASLQANQKNEKKKLHKEYTKIQNNKYRDRGFR